mgnify:CR=1 FL=1
MADSPGDPGLIAIVGAGGVGGLLGGQLARAGRAVHLLTRGAALAAIRARGVIVRGPDGEHAAPLARVADDPAALGPAAIVVVAVKTWQLAALAPALAPLVGDGAVVIPVQNGVEASEALAAALGDGPVIGGVARMLSWTERPGEIRWQGLAPSLVIGPRRASQRAAVERAAAALAVPGVDIVVSERIEVERWTKLVFIASVAAVGAVTGAPIGGFRDRKSTRLNSSHQI